MSVLKYYDETTSTWIPIAKGDKGDTGATGVTGPEGPQGPAGETPTLSSLGITSTTVELNYTDGVTGSIQTQLDNKLSTASYTASDVLTKLKTVDGTTSGIDADLLDGQHGGYYATAATTYNKTEVDNAISAVVTSLDWKESVATYEDIATTYASPVDGWAVSTKDTDTVYRYSGTTWVAISANSIPLASGSNDGKMSSSDFTKLSGIATGANNYAHPSGDGNLHVPANGTTNSGKVLTAGAAAGTYTWETPSASGDYAPATHSHITVANTTLFAGSWSNSEYTISNANITANSVITLSPAQGTTLAQYNGIAGAKIIERSISAGQVVLRALGTTPTIACPIVMTIEG